MGTLIEKEVSSKETGKHCLYFSFTQVSDLGLYAIKLSIANAFCVQAVGSPNETTLPSLPAISAL